MECKVVGRNLVRIDAQGGSIFLKGDKEVRELIKKLSDALFELKDFIRKEVCHDVEM